MTRKLSHTAFSILVLLTLTLIWTPPLDAKRKRVARDPDAPTNEQSKVLGWGPVKTPNRGKNPEFMIRGTLVSLEPVKDAPLTYTVNILPVEIINNHQRFLTMAEFRNGVTLTIKIPKVRAKELKKGRAVEFNQYYTEEVEQVIGGAKMVAMTLHQDIQGYPAGVGSYLAKPGFYPVQYLNALKGLKLYSGNIQNKDGVKAHLDILASKAKDPELKTQSQTSLIELFKAQPTGNCQEDKVTQTFKCN